VSLERVGEHVGGYDEFGIDITDATAKAAETAPAGPPKYLRRRERHANRGLKPWVQETSAESHQLNVVLDPITM